MNDEWIDVADISENEPIKRSTLSVAVFYDNNLKRQERVSSLPGFVRKAINDTVKGMSADNPQTLQLYVTRTSWETKETPYPFYVSSMLDDFAFTITLGNDLNLSVARRYVCKDLPKAASKIR